MNPDELEKISKKELLSLARERKVKTESTMTREELVEKLRSVVLQNEISRLVQEKTAGSPEQLPSFPAQGEKQTITKEKRLEQGEFELPLSYQETVIVLLVRDPYWIYTYWDFHPQLQAELAQLFHGWEKVPLALRVHNLSRAKSGAGGPGYYDISINHAANNWYINVGEAGKEYQVELGYYDPGGIFRVLARSNRVTTPPDRISDLVDEEWMIVEEDFRRLYRLAGGAGWGESSVELVESLLKRLEKEAGSGAVSSISSPAGYPPPGARRFWLVLDAELIVYGATEPDALLTVQGRPVKLRPDGTFTLRMALPDGTQSIPVTAQSADGIDTITITTNVSRHTHQGEKI